MQLIEVIDEEDKKSLVKVRKPVDADIIKKTNVVFTTSLLTKLNAYPVIGII